MTRVNRLSAIALQFGRLPWWQWELPLLTFTFDPLLWIRKLMRLGRGSLGESVLLGSLRCLRMRDCFVII